MATKQMKKNELKFEDFEPVSVLQELPEKFILLVKIPGFRKEDFRVQVDTSGKLTVKGQKLTDDNKYKRFNKVFQLPPDSDIEKIRGKFEGDVLTVTVSRKEKVLPPTQEVKSSTNEAEAKPREEAKDSMKKEEESKPKEAEAKPREEVKDSVKKEEESKPKEESKQISDKKEEEVKSKEAETDNKIEEEPKISSEKEEESAKEKEETGMPDIKEAASRINDIINQEKKMKKGEEKKIISWKKRITQEAKNWSNYASFDNMLEVVNRNRKEIAVAVAVLSIGFIVARKLSSGK